MNKEKQSIGRVLLGTWNTKTIIGIAIGAALFGVLMNFGGIRVFTNTSLTTAMIIDVIVAAVPSSRCMEWIEPTPPGFS